MRSTEAHRWESFPDFRAEAYVRPRESIFANTCALASSSDHVPWQIIDDSSRRFSKDFPAPIRSRSDFLVRFENLSSDEQNSASAIIHFTKAGNFAESLALAVERRLSLDLSLSLDLLAIPRRDSDDPRVIARGRKLTSLLPISAPSFFFHVHVRVRNY